MTQDYNPDLAAADLFAHIAYQGRRIAADPGLTPDTADALNDMAKAADAMGRLVYYITTGDVPPDLPTDPPVGAYAHRVYGPDANPDDVHYRRRYPRLPPNVVVRIEPATERSR